MSKTHQEPGVADRKPTIVEIRDITDRYENSPLEADGMCNILHFFLTEAGIAHRVMSGQVRKNDEQPGGIWPHFWIETETAEGTAIIDYRAQMWLGADQRIPNGVFLPTDFPAMNYEGKEITSALLPESVVLAVLEPIKIPDEWMARLAFGQP